MIRNIYKTLKGEEFNGLVSHISYERGNYGLEQAVLNIFTENNACYSYDGLFNLVVNNDDMFVVSPDNYSIKGLDRGFHYITILNNDGHLQTSQSDSYVFEYPFVTLDGAEYTTNVFKSQKYRNYSNYIFDEVGNRFFTNSTRQ